MTSPDTMTSLDFWVAGIPKPQGSKRAFMHPHTHRAVVIEQAGKPLKDWRHDMKLAAVDAWGDRIVVVQPAAVQLRVEFVLHRPVGLSKNKPTPNAVKTPDLDKLVRAVGDALKGVVYADDSQVISIRAFKRTAELGEPTGANIGIDVLEAE